MDDCNNCSPADRSSPRRRGGNHPSHSQQTTATSHHHHHPTTSTATTSSSCSTQAAVSTHYRAMNNDTTTTTKNQTNNVAVYGQRLRYVLGGGRSAVFSARYKYQLIFIIILILVRIRVRLADCQTMMDWGITVGHSELGDLQTGCAIERDTMSDISIETITPQELDRRIRNGNVTTPTTTTIAGGIPRILHQSYKSNLVPDHVVPFVRSWHKGLAEYDSSSTTLSSSPKDGSQETLPWIYVWWTDDDLPWLIKTYYPQYLKTFTRMPHPIMKADTARYFVLHHFGGLYADMDIEYTPHCSSIGSENTTTSTSTCTLSQALSSSFASSSIASALTTDRAVVFHGCEDNSLLASSPNSTFFSRVHEVWYDAATDPKNLRSVHKISGVDMLGGVCDKERGQPYLTVLGYNNINVEDNNNNNNNNKASESAASTGGPFDIHHGTNAWRWKTKRSDIVYFLDIVIATSMIVLLIWTFFLSTFFGALVSTLRLPSLSNRHYSTE